ncbi:DUF2279 domain-containing protein [Novosphingobium profundi]|uniref:DUF2279 domain-containing protein n=1 Tax=Novosphingobium profundi TaxID=1774954 RepID=UPI001BDB5363|nr:DUF2279 domain-containing protein [Novosphingobium profundi]
MDSAASAAVVREVGEECPGACPRASAPARWTDHAAPQDSRDRGFFRQAATAAVLATGFTVLNEFSDAFEPDGDYSMQDVAMDVVGAGFSVLRNTVPGLKEKLAFKIEIVPNSDFYTFEGKRHLFVGVGLNVGELLLGRSQSPIGKAAHTALDYLQLPYTSLRCDTTGRFGASGPPR